MSESIALEGKDIKELAELAGFQIVDADYESELEAEFTIHSSKDGFKVNNEYLNKIETYMQIVTSDDFCGEVFPLGSPKASE